MTMPEQDILTMDVDCKITSNNSSLSSRLQSLVKSTREVNKLGKGRVPLDTSFAKKQYVTPKKTPKCPVSESLYENRGDVLSSPKTPSRRLNPTASAYTPPQQALPTFSPAHKDQTPVSEELQRAFREGMTLGRLSGWHDGYKEGFQKGRAVGKAEGKNL